MATKRDIERARRFNDRFPVGTVVHYWAGGMFGEPSGKAVLIAPAEIRENFGGIAARIARDKGGTDYIQITHLRPAKESAAETAARVFTLLTENRALRAERGTIPAPNPLVLVEVVKQMATQMAEGKAEPYVLTSAEAAEVRRILDRMEAGWTTIQLALSYALHAGRNMSLQEVARIFEKSSTTP